MDIHQTPSSMLVILAPWNSAILQKIGQIICQLVMTEHMEPLACLIMWIYLQVRHQSEDQLPYISENHQCTDFRRLMPRLAENCTYLNQAIESSERKKVYFANIESNKKHSAPNLNSSFHKLQFWWYEMIFYRFFKIDKNGIFLILNLAKIKIWTHFKIQFSTSHNLFEIEFWDYR